MANLVDFHLHTDVSDGSDTVEGLYHKILQSGVHTFSVTDHDMMEGTLEMEKLTAENPDLMFIRGIEFSCITPVKKCHILGYNFDPSNEIFQKIYHHGIHLRQEKTQKRMDFWKNELGLELTEEEANWLRSQKSPGRPTFGKIILDRGLAPDMGTAIRQFVSPCKVGNDRIDATDAINAIRSAGGITVWAHPLGGEGEKRLTTEEFYAQLQTLIQSGIQGLECYYSRYTKEEIDFLLNEANKHHLLVSGGSDYHGDNKPNLHIGKLCADNTDVNENALTLLNYLFS